MNKIIQRSVGAGALIAALAASMFFLPSMNVNAATGPGKYSGGTCSSAKAACYHGAAWVKYKIVDKKNDLILPNVKTWWAKDRLVDIKKKCKDFDSVFVLIRFETEPKTGNFTGYAATSTQVKHVRWKSTDNKKSDYIKNNYIFWNSDVSNTSPYILDFEGFKDSKAHDWSDPLRAKHDGDPVGPGTAYRAYRSAIADNPDAVGTDSNGKKITWNSPNSTIGWFCFGPTVKKVSGKFYSKSKVKDPDGKETDYSAEDGGGTEKPTSGKASAGTYRIPDGTAETATVKVKFTHHIVISPASRHSLFSKVKDLSTKWTVKQTMTDKSNSTAGSGTWTVKDFEKGESTYYKSVSYTVPVTVAKGKKVKVCQTISYNHKNFVVDEDKAKLIGDPSGKNDSEACITVSYNGTSIGEDPTYVCPLPGFDHNENYGSTVAASEVKNYNNSDWKTEVLAKPGDEIQFRHTLCAGAHTVKASWTNGATRKHEVTTVNKFRLQADVSGVTLNKYLFNRDDLASEKSFTPALSSNPSVLSDIKPEEAYTGEGSNPYYYGFRLYSPRNASTGGASSYASNPYNCIFYDGNLAQTYQVTGFGSEYSPATCASAKIYNSGGSSQEISRSNVGRTISQSIIYNDLKAWVDHSYTPSDCGIDRSRSASTWYVGYPGGNGYLKNTCVFDRTLVNYYAHDVYTTCWRDKTNDKGEIIGKESYSCYWYTWYSDAQQYKLLDDYDMHYPISISNNQAQKTATVKVPFNFTTSTKAKIKEGADDGIIFAGENVHASYEVNIYERQNSDVDSDDSYMTMTPNDTLVKLMSFTINSNVREDTGDADRVTNIAGISLSGEPMEGYLARVIGSSNGVSNFQTMNLNGHGGHPQAINKEGELHGKNGTGVMPDPDNNNDKYNVAVPDVEVGSKFCVVVGISHADSHDIFSTDDVPVGQGANSTSMNNASRSWRISNASCRTIAKKPSLQTWGGLYSQGIVKTSQSPKTTFGGGDHIFGSWSDTIAIGAKAISGFASGSALGYSTNGGGSASSSTSYCDMTKMSISNKKAFCDNKYSGNAGVFSEISDNLEKILSRYTPDNPTVHYEGYDVSTAAAYNEADILNGGGRYTYVRGDAYINNPLTAQVNETRVIHVDGTLHVNQNICTGYGSCAITGNNSLVLNQRNSQSFIGIEQIPQIIIIAENIDIDAEVTQIDAWLFARGGEINTCTTGIISADYCNKTIIFNGPVFASSLALNRTAGAYPGANANGLAKATADLASNYPTGRYFNNSGQPTVNGYGSATAGEIFNLRPDAYFWAYNQANRLSQATVVYMRELAPRY